MTSKAFYRIIAILLVIIAFLLVQFVIHRAQQENVRKLVVAEEMRYSMSLLDDESSGDAEYAKLDDAIEKQKKQVSTLELYFITTQLVAFAILVLLTFNIVNILKKNAVRAENERVLLLNKKQDLRLDNIFNTSTEGIYLLDRNFVIKRASTAVEEKFKNILPLVGEVCYKKVHNRETPCEGCPVNETMEKGRISKGTVYSSHLHAWIENTASPILDPVSGEITEVTVNFRDVTESIKIKEELTQYQSQLEELLRTRTDELQWSEAKMQAVLDGSVAIVFYSPDGTIQDINHAFIEMLGYDKDDVVGHNVTEFYTKGFLEASIGLREQLKEGKIDEFRLDLALVHKNGTTIWVDANAIPIRDEFGKCIQLAGICLNITDRKNLLSSLEIANTAAIRAKKQTAIIMDMAPFSVTLFNSDLDALDCNAEAVKLFGFTHKEEYLDNFFNLMPTQQPSGQLSSDYANMHIREAFATGYKRFEWVHQKLDGELIPTDITLIRYEFDGEPVV
ncbi:MAG: PAS domain-containing protein, partial [Thermoguttaceae bacterium]